MIGKKTWFDFNFFQDDIFFLFLNIETNQLLALLRFQINPYEKCNKDLVDLIGPKEYWIIGKKKHGLTLIVFQDDIFFLFLNIKTMTDWIDLSFTA
jgi:hypothetical protein